MKNKGKKRFWKQQLVCVEHMVKWFNLHESMHLDVDWGLSSSKYSSILLIKNNQRVESEIPLSVLMIYPSCVVFTFVP